MNMCTPVWKPLSFSHAITRMCLTAPQLVGSRTDHHHKKLLNWSLMEMSETKIKRDLGREEWDQAALCTSVLSPLLILGNTTVDCTAQTLLMLGFICLFLMGDKYKVDGSQCSSNLSVTLQRSDHNRRWICQLTEGENVRASHSYITILNDNMVINVSQTQGQSDKTV
ncbi:hypothetical protein JZ751_002837, partial [Albula glossodonta]